MLEVLDREGKAIIALNASLFASDVSDRIEHAEAAGARQGGHAA